MKIRVFCLRRRVAIVSQQWLLLCFLVLLTSGAQAKDGYYDPTFSGSGLTYFDFGPPAVPDNAVNDTASSVAVMKDGRLVVAGNTGDTSSAGALEYAITRLLRDGGTDPSFSLPYGYKVIGACAISFLSSPLTPETHALGMALQTDGKVVVGGYCRDRGNAVQGPRQAFIARHNADGTRDPGVGNGLTTFPVPYAGQTATGRAVAIQPDGKIVLVGDVLNSVTGLAHWFVARFNSDLTPDGEAHIFVVRDASYSEYAHAVAVQADGRIVIAGTGVINPNWSYPAVIRLTTGLERDPAFFGAPWVGACGEYLDGVNTLALAEPYAIYLGGYTNPDGDGRFAYCLWELDGDGYFYHDVQFSFAWPDLFAAAPASAVATAIAIQADGRILLSGPVTLSNGGHEMGTLRLESYDSVDTTFADGGYSYAGFYIDAAHPVNNNAYGMALQDNHPVIVGSTDYYSVYSEEGTDFLVTRLQNERIFVNGFEFQ